MGLSLGISSDPGPGEAEAQALLRCPRAPWQGWGCSLAWCGKAMGSSAEAQAWADLLFTLNTFETARLWRQADSGAPVAVPGLGMNVVRYNIGGVGRCEEGSGEKRSSKSRGWYAEIEGFQPGPGEAFDWERDGEQRQLLMAAVERGADVVELFANAPMWWMMDSKSSFGGGLARHEDFAVYLAEVAAQARRGWQVPVCSVSPYNEPSAGWWKFPHDQEGCNVPAGKQSELLVRLRGELDRLGLEDVVIAASDENTPEAALSTWQTLRSGPAQGCVGRINVHAYDGLSPWREAVHPGVRSQLRRRVKEDGLPLWMSEHGCPEKDGIGLAQTILEDICYMQPTAWVYWQVVEHHCSWGFVEAAFHPDGTLPTLAPHPKYYVFAHFSRFLRPGMEMLQCSEPWATSAFGAEGGQLACVLLNAYSGPLEAKLRLPAFARAPGKLPAVLSEPQREGACWMESSVECSDMEDGGLVVSVSLPPLAICSVHMDGVRRRCDGEQCTGAVTATQVRELARAAAWGATAERLYGEGEARVLAAWHQLEHACGQASCQLETAITCPRRREEEVGHVRDLCLHAAWGAANERKYGSKNKDAVACWQRFHSSRRRCAVQEDVAWLIYNTCWAVANEHFLREGKEDRVPCLTQSFSLSRTKNGQDADARAEQHFEALGAGARVLPRRAYRTPQEVPSFPRWVALLRHGEALHNADQAAEQQPDPSLTDKGRRQAREAAVEGPAAEAVRAADLVVVSPMMRTLETAQLLLQGRSNPVRVKVNALATERHAKPCDEGSPKSQLLQKMPSEVASWEGWDALPEQWWPGPADDNAARVQQFTRALQEEQGERVLVVSHGGFCQLVVGCYLENCDVVYCNRDLA